MKTDKPSPTYLKNYRPPAYLIDKVHLDVRLHPTRTEVRSKLKMRPNLEAGPKRARLELDGEMLELVSIKLDGAALGPKDYKVSDSDLVIAKPPQAPFTLEIVTICNPEANTALSGLYRSKGIYCTQCEAQGFRRITYFLDRPDVLATYTLRIEADREEASILLGNGNPRERGTLDGGKRHYAIWHDPHPKPCYLFALVGGNLTSIASTFKTKSGRDVDLRIYVEPGKERRCAWAMDSLRRSMIWDEKTFGLEYDLDVFNIVAVSDFNMGAMENKGLNIFNDRLVLASPETATDTNFADIERVIAHEYFHNWTGNRITCRDWFQLCLKEGLTVYRDQEFSADERARGVERIDDVRALKARQFPEDGGPLAHPVRPDHYIEINNFYTATVYEKGAELVRMIETLLGKAAFRRGMDLYFERHDGQAATIEQFIACFADVSGRDLKQFAIWYEQAGTPELVTSLSYDAKRKTADLTIEQVLPPTPGQPKKKPLHIPVRMGLLGANGHDLDLALADGTTLKNGVLEVTKRAQTFRFINVPSRPVPSLLRGFSAPVNLTVDLADADLAFLMAHDGDEFNRWQAGQQYAARLLIADVRAIRKGGRPARPEGYITALTSIARDEALAPAFRAQMLALPSESDLARIIGQDIDPDAIRQARIEFIKSLVKVLDDDLQSIYKRFELKGAYSPAADDAGKRAFRNAALQLIALRGTADDEARAARHVATAKNLTDEMAGLAALNNRNSTARKDALAAFFERWKGDHLVIDHWFAIQAAAPQTGTLGAVIRLARHPLFSLKNPNKARTLIGIFASNPTQFNRRDGKGYTFVGDKILEIDGFNPQVAARLLTAFRSWKSLEPERRKLARATLQRIAKTKSLSRDATEIVGKILV